MASSTTRPTDSTTASRVSRLTVKPKDLHQEDRADQGYRNGDDRDQHRTEGAEEEEDHHHDDQQRVAKGLEHLLDGVLDIVGRIVGQPGLHAARQVALDRFHLRPHPLDDIEGIGVGQRPDAHEDRGLSGEVHFGIIVLGAELTSAISAEPTMAPFCSRTARCLNSSTVFEIGVGGHVHLDQRTLAPPQGRQEIIGSQCLAHLSRADVQAAIRSGLSQMRMAKVRAPRMSARCTPSMADRRGWTMRTRYSVISFCLSMSEVKLR